jgi:hypothetical protein
LMVAPGSAACINPGRLDGAGSRLVIAHDGSNIAPSMLRRNKKPCSAQKCHMCARMVP